MTARILLPFVPLAITFQNVQYYVDTPQEMRELGYKERQIQLLHDITGTFRPGVLTALMGITGAGKTTLLDVLAGRKTDGTIKGDIRIGGHPKVQQTFARISGYCEQSDVHSPQITVEESVIYSAWLRLPPQVDSKTRQYFVNEVLETIELDEIRYALVGLPGISGLSAEQRKRLTIAVELVSNPSIIFMDEPTSGLGARAAAIVMRAVKNTSETGRTVVCTIHQPNIDIFEAFDELILLKKGKMIFSGYLGKNSSRVIEYFEGIAGIPRIKDKINPATWIMDVTSTMENQLGVDFEKVYKESILYKYNQELVQQLRIPLSGSKELSFSTCFPQKVWGQFLACLWRLHLSYWRSPSYTLTRILVVIILAIIFALLFWKKGKSLDSQQSLFNMLGSMYLSLLFIGVFNCSMVIPVVAIQRSILYREKYAGMYSPWAYALAQVVIEIPYSFIQTLLLVIILYPTIGYYGSFYKIAWFFYWTFCSLLYFTYLGMMLLSMTPSVPVATILATFFFQTINLFSGFILPGPRIPKWWIWMYYITPFSWTLKGLFTSQYGDVEKEILVFGEIKTVSAFLEEYFGFQNDMLFPVAIAHIAYLILFASLFTYCIRKLNFQKR